MNRLIVLLGPTAVGKTALSILLAKKLQTEIISGDSMLIYQQMNIGTAKPDEQERQGIVHHLIDILEPWADYSVVHFQNQASDLIDRINQKEKIPILAGGTGLYIRALLEDYHFDETPNDEAYRKELEELSLKMGSDYLHQLLQQKLPAVAARLHPNDSRRIIRALEVYRCDGEKEEDPLQNRATKVIYDSCVIGLIMDRALLYERINQRVDLMVEAGLIKEVQELLNRGVPRNCQAMQAIGYKEIVKYLDGEFTLAKAIEEIKKATRHFAKRQLTWYRKMPYIEWVTIDPKQNIQDYLEVVYKLVAQKWNLK